MFQQIDSSAEDSICEAIQLTQPTPDLYNIGLYPDLEDILPGSYMYHIQKFDQLDSYSSEPRFTAIIRVRIESKNESDDWVTEFQRLSYTTLRVRGTYPQNTQKILYKVIYRCQHNTRPRRAPNKGNHPKHTNCPAKLTITIKQKKLKRSGDKFLKILPCEIHVQHVHNHLLHDIQSVKYRDPGAEVREKFLELFKLGHTPTTALKVHKQDLHLQAESEEIYLFMIGDRNVCPNISWVYRYYYKSYKVAVAGDFIPTLQAVPNTKPSEDYMDYNFEDSSHSSVEEVSTEGTTTPAPEPRPATPSTKTDSEIQSAIKSWDIVSSTITTLIRTKPDQYIFPVQKFTTRFDKLETDVERAAALAQFASEFDSRISHPLPTAGGFPTKNRSRKKPAATIAEGSCVVVNESNLTQDEVVGLPTLIEICQMETVPANSEMCN